MRERMFRRIAPLAAKSEELAMSQEFPSQSEMLAHYYFALAIGFPYDPACIFRGADGKTQILCHGSIVVAWNDHSYSNRGFYQRNLLWRKDSGRHHPISPQARAPARGTHCDSIRLL